MSFAIEFVRFRESQVKGDTIPKPAGLGSGGPLGGLSVRHRSGGHPVFVQCLSGIDFGSY